MRLSEAREQYLAHRRMMCSKATVTQDAFVTRRFTSTVGDIYVHNLTAHHVEQWFITLGGDHMCRDGLVRGEVKATTFNYYYARIKALAGYLQARGLTRVDLMAHVRPRKVARLQRQQRRAQMLDAANDLFAERGYEEVSVEDIARAAGVQRGLVHHYFGGRTQVYLALLGRLDPIREEPLRRPEGRSAARAWRTRSHAGSTGPRPTAVSISARLHPATTSPTAR